MNHDSTRRLRVGLLVLGTGGLFVALLLVIAGSSMHRDVRSYFVSFDESVKGMVVGSKVNFQGVPIGAVADIRFDAGHTLVEIRVDPNKATLQESTRARLDRLLVTGQVTIELEGYEAGSKELADGATIRSQRLDPIEELKSSLPEILQKVDILIDRATSLVARSEHLLGPENGARIERILDATAVALEALPKEIEATGSELRATIAAYRPVAEDARALLANLSEVAAEDISPTMGATREMLASVSRTAAALEASAVGIERLTQEAAGILGGNRGALRVLLTNANDAMRELRAFARQVRTTPQSLVFGVEDGEIAVPASPSGGNR